MIGIFELGPWLITITKYHLVKTLPSTILCFIILFISACQSHGGERVPLTLNEGEKWVVSDEMKPHLNQVIDILKKYVSSDNSDYANMAKKLKEQNTNLIKSCNMKGPAHDELHKWLMPHMKLIEDLGKSETQQEADRIIGELEASFVQYNVYFE